MHVHIKLAFGLLNMGKAWWVSEGRQEETEHYPALFTEGEDIYLPCVTQTCLD